MKRIGIFGLLIFIIYALVFTAMVMAAEFSADVFQKNPAGVKEHKIYIKGEKMRMETEEGIMIMDMGSGKYFMLQVKDKTYIEMPQTLAMPELGSLMEKSDEELAKIADKKYIGAETINGYACDKYEIIYHDTSLGKMTQWYSKKLQYPIKAVYQSPYGEMYTEYKNIEEGGISDSLFEIPSGYEKITIPGMGGNMGMPQDMGDMPEMDDTN